ncbi:MAG: YdeI/OmpD-associated family protein [Bacteroidetes bacterium]|nr:YdeI/OmpD-associated family protein [Bacteroidota bacterium]
MEKKKPTLNKDLVIPKELSSALAKNKKAKATFENFPPSHKREYALWISEAKTEVTKNKRVETTMEWLTEGKSRNWKYMKNKK